ncbi:hypothetical protein SeMB42_g03223 [Synchytrium endobioticum]|uniref:Nuclear segregation protein Bfr1 n=1 Tax=Synchytrium endobioticum TaxID=286115 RepID=A0A507CTW7_9FUNG|nr:hypothetical protein SeLEV6574_g05514 [Synchytrium endobioticum]TPX47716.1 hypothetical protein SeMB42_g03223 [Synchytrium endobioticum]
MSSTTEQSPAANGPPRHPRPVKPDEEQFRREVDALNSSIDDIKASINKLQESRSLSSDGTNKDTVATKRQELRATIDELCKKRSQLNDSKNAVVEDLKALQAGIKKKFETLKASKASSSSADFDRQIAALEAQQQSGCASLMEEKKIIAEISSLRKSKKAIESTKSDVAALSGSIDADRKAIEECRAALDAMDPEREQVRKALDEARSSLNALDEDRKSIQGERMALKVKLDAEYIKKREVQDTYRQRKEEYFEAMKLERAKRAEQQKKRRDELEHSKIQRELQEVLESADVPAFSSEIAMADVLIRHLTTTYLAPSSLPSEPAASMTSSVTPSRAVDSSVPDGAMVMKKKDGLDEDFIQLGTPRKSKAGRRSTTSSGGSPGPSQALKLDLELITQFAKLHVDIPSNVGGVEGTIATLETKKKEWLEAQMVETKKLKEKAESKAAGLRAKLSGLSQNGTAENGADSSDKNALSS